MRRSLPDCVVRLETEPPLTAGAGAGQVHLLSRLVPGVTLMWMTALGAGTVASAQEGAQADSTDLPGVAHESPSRITDEYIPLMDIADLQRPGPLLELGDPFQSSGPISEGLEIPGGAVWQPSFLVFGLYRSAMQSFERRRQTTTEWVNRLDIFGNLQLTGTERILVGFRPLDRDNEFAGYQFQPDAGSGWQEAFDLDLQTLFFEGELGELIPALDPDDSRALDFGFSVGRQPIFFQEGMLINDDMDAVGITRNSLSPMGASNLRMTLLYGWNQINRGDNQEASSTELIGLFTETDWRDSTIDLDLVYVSDRDGDADGAFWGLSSVQRHGKLNTAVRALGSHALEEQSSAVSNGHLLFGELSWTPDGTDNLAYVNAYLGIDDFTSAARGPATGGPLGRTGLLFAAVGMGSYGAPLGNRPGQSFGLAMGHQMFFDSTRKQLTLEIGGRQETEADRRGALALGASYQQALGQQLVLRLDAFGSAREGGDYRSGARVELQYKF